MIIATVTEVVLESSASFADAAKSGVNSANTNLKNLGKRNTINAALVIKY